MNKIEMEDSRNEFLMDLLETLITKIESKTAIQIYIQAFMDSDYILNKRIDYGNKK